MTGLIALPDDLTPSNVTGFRLCYVSEPWAYFTTLELDKQWGDDWNDAPYEHNAGEPYRWRAGRGDPYTVAKVAYDGPLEDPASWAEGGNSRFSVEAINGGATHWLTTDRYAGKDRPRIYIPAGTNPLDFANAVSLVGGHAYFPVI